MNWNYRVTTITVSGELLFAVREVYYEDDVIVAWSKDPDPATGESREELIETLRLMGRAVLKPVVDLDAELTRIQSLSD